MPQCDCARLATPADAARIAEIYNQGIEDRIATFETELRTVDTVRSWFSRPYPIVVVERDGNVIAWASASEYRPRSCYASICEFSVYVDRSARGSGAGTRAMQALMRACSEAGFHKLVSRVFVENRASLTMLEKLGFRQVGIYCEHAQLDGEWRDVVIVEVILPRSAFTGLPVGQRITVVKRHPRDEKPSIEYVGTVLPSGREGWIALSATWPLPNMNVGGVRFETGGNLIEYFSPTARYNVFRVHDRAGAFTGVYGNVTALPEISADRNELIWTDQWLDVVKLPDGSIEILDEDEYETTGLGITNPVLDHEIRASLLDLVESLRRGDWDF